MSQNNACSFISLDAFIQQSLLTFGSSLKLVTQHEQRQRVDAFLAKHYSICFPDINTDDSDNAYNRHGFTFFSENEQGAVSSTVTLLFQQPPPAGEKRLFEHVIAGIRAAEQQYVQVGRFVIDEQTQKQNGLLIEYLRLFYHLPKLLGANIVIGLIRDKDVPTHKHFGADIVQKHTGISYGSQHEFAAALWQLDHLSKSFFKCIKVTRQPEDVYLPKLDIAQIQQQQIHAWDRYAKSFAAIQTPMQAELQAESCRYLSGDVADFGCGSAKVAPLLDANDAISSYLGIDYSNDMLRLAEEQFSILNCQKCRTYLGKIESFQAAQFDSALSLNSFYTWPEPKRVLSHIASLLKPDACFVLATPNPHIDPVTLAKIADPHLALHPHYAEFKQMNIEFIERYRDDFCSLDTLIRLAYQCGFYVEKCHQEFYGGGLNFLVLRREGIKQVVETSASRGLKLVA